MIFDFRLRPPYMGFADLSIFNPVCNAVAPHDVNAWRSESAHQKSFPLFLEEMREAGIEKGVVMARATSSFAASVPNDDVLALMQEYPDKFIPFGAVDVSAGILPALAEARRCKAMGFKGIAVEPGFCDPARKANDPTLYPVYALCAELDLILVITSSFMVGPDIDFSNPVYIQRVANDFPTLQIVVSHACYPWLMQMVNIMLMCPNIWIVPDMYMHNPSAPGHEIYGNAVRWLKGERFLYGSAYPCYDMRQAAHDFRLFNLDETLTKKVMWDNAHKLLGL